MKLASPFPARGRYGSSRSPITIAITRFEDITARGLRCLLAEDPSISLATRFPGIRLVVLSNGPTPVHTRRELTTLGELRG